MRQYFAQIVSGSETTDSFFEELSSDSNNTKNQTQQYTTASYKHKNGSPVGETKPKVKKTSLSTLGELGRQSPSGNAGSEWQGLASIILGLKNEKNFKESLNVIVDPQTKKVLASLLSSVKDSEEYLQQFIQKTQQQYERLASDVRQRIQIYESKKDFDSSLRRLDQLDLSLTEVRLDLENRIDKQKIELLRYADSTDGS